ncbi:MAG: alpha/beta hydrolase [Acidobacteria bacterium]|nr:alpha/beta hydrolase [Acidobacteriota bacterium]
MRADVRSDVAARLDPEIAGVLAGFPPVTYAAETLAQRRAVGPVPVPLSDRVERRDIAVPGPEGAPDVVLRFHRPVGAEGPLPCIYWMHGGGYVVGSYAGEDARFDRWCERLTCAGVSVEYRLAPEHPFPAPLEDCYAGLRWLAAHAAELGIDSARLGIGGSSAGGGLAAGLALLARDRGEIAPAFQVLNCPMLDDRQATMSSQWEAPVWSPASNRFGWSSYLGRLDGTDAIPAYAAPARATDLSGLPPALVAVGTVDGFFDEDVTYAERLHHAGVEVDLHVYPGGPHGFEAVAPTSALAARSKRETEEWLARRLGRT